jgi:hypothetical protein
VASDGTLPTIEQQQQEYADLGLTTTTHPAERDFLGSWAVPTAAGNAEPTDDVPLAPTASNAVEDDGLEMLQQQRGAQG